MPRLYSDTMYRLSISNREGLFRNIPALHNEGWLGRHISRRSLYNNSLLFTRQ